MFLQKSVVHKNKQAKMVFQHLLNSYSAIFVFCLFFSSSVIAFPFWNNSDCIENPTLKPCLIRQFESNFNASAYDKSMKCFLQYKIIF